MMADTYEKSWSRQPDESSAPYSDNSCRRSIQKYKMQNTKITLVTECSNKKKKKNCRKKKQKEKKREVS